MRGAWKGIIMRQFNFLVVLAILASLLIFCSDDDMPTNGSGSVGSSHYAVAEWKEVIDPFGTIMPDTLNINLNIRPDTTYLINVIELPDKVLFSNAGNWNASSDTMYLHGTKCMILDTTADPDTLMPLDDTTCAKPIPLFMNIDTTAIPWVWTVKAADLKPLIDAFPVADEHKSIALILTFLLEKQ
jgi:hypothetical protein